MASTLLLRRRIKTAQNVSKTTKAMQMIAASKLKKAQHQAVISRPYVNKLSDLASTLADQKSDITHAYIHPVHHEEKTLYVFFGPDKGLCGGLVTNMLREFMHVRSDSNALFISIGKKLEVPMATLAQNRLIASFHFGTTLPSFAQVLPLITLINEQYLSGKVSRVVVVSPHFTNLFSQTPTAVQLLPVPLMTEEARTDISVPSDMLFEPTAETLLPEVLKRYIEMVLYQQFLETFASEQAARMMAMQNATKNAKEIVSELRLIYNKARQERITKEILDISSAAIALSAEE